MFKISIKFNFSELYNEDIIPDNKDFPDRVIPSIKTGFLEVIYFDPSALIII